MKIQLIDIAAKMESPGEPVVYLFGRSDQDESVCLRVSGIYPNIFIPQPSVTTHPADAINAHFNNRNFVRRAELCRRTAGERDPCLE